jgi:DNA-binding transcriptional MerR regulator
MADTYSISDLAAEFMVTARAIRFYEDKGLLKPKRKGQARIFSSQDRTKLKLILRGKRLGMSLAESQEIIDMYDPSGSNLRQLELLATRIQERKHILREQKRDLERMMSDLNSAERECLEAIAATQKK